MIKQTQVKKFKKYIEDNENIILFHHVNPDGDCMATSFGLAQVLRDNYPKKNIKVAANIKDWTPHLRYMDDYIEWDRTTTRPEHNDYLAIIGDVSGMNRVAYFDNFKDSIKTTIVYDHHENELDIPNVDLFWSQPKYPAAGMMTYELSIAMELKLKWKSSLIINHGIITDTNSFMFSPGNKMTFDYSGELNKIIGEKRQRELLTKMNQRSLNDIKFQGWILENFKIYKKNVAYICITNDDLKRFKYKPDQASQVNLLSGIKDIESWVFFIQYDENVRVEFRSRNIFVNEIAEEFGGGGHQNASGCRLTKMSEYKKVIQRVNEVVENFKNI